MDTGSGYSAAAGERLGQWARMRALEPVPSVIERWAAAQAHFVGLLSDTFGYTADEASAVLDALHRHHLLVIQIDVARYQLTPGAPWDRASLDALT